MTSVSDPYDSVRKVVPDPDEPATVLMKRYRVTSKDGINAFSQRFRDYALKIGIPLREDGNVTTHTYILGSRNHQVSMTIGSTNTVPEVIFDGHDEEDIGVIVSTINSWGVGLEDISDEPITRSADR